MKIWWAVSFGEVADRERKHPGEGAFGHLGTSGKEASRIRGTRVPRRKVTRAFLGQLTLGPGPIGAIPGRKFSRAFLGLLTLGPGPVGAIGLGRLARGTDPGPMVPITSRLVYLMCTIRLSPLLLSFMASPNLVGIC